ARGCGCIHRCACGGACQRYAIIQQNGYVVGVIVPRSQVEATIPIEVPHCHRFGACAHGIVDGGLERTIAVAQQCGYVISTEVHHSQVEATIPVEVSHRH